MQFQAIQFAITVLLVYLPFGSQPLAETPIARNSSEENSSAQNSSSQSPSKNRKDEQRENQRVNKAQRELSQTRSELNDLQDSWEKEYRNFLSVRGKFLQLKKVSENTEQEAESRLGEQLGIPAQLLAVKQKGEQFRQASAMVLDSLKSQLPWKAIDEQIDQLDKAIESGLHPVRNSPMSSNEIEDLEQTLRDKKQELNLIEQNALQESPATRELKSDFESAQKKLVELREKLDPKKIEQDSKVKKSRAELDVAYKSLRDRSNSLDRARIAVERKANELGRDYQEFLKARQADAADKNQTKKKSPSKKK